MIRLPRCLCLLLFLVFAPSPQPMLADFVLDTYGTPTAAGSWSYAFLPDTGHSGDINYVPTAGDAAKATFLGYVAPDAAGLWSSPGKGPSVPASELYVFETLIRSVVDRSVAAIFGGDDGHALFLDDVLVGGGGFGTDIPFAFDLVANMPRKLTVAVHNGDGPMVIGLWRQDATNLGLSSIDGLLFEAPEPPAVLLASSALVICAWRRRHLLSFGRGLRVAWGLLGLLLVWQGTYRFGYADPPFVSAEGNFWKVPDGAHITGSSPGHPCSNCELTNMFTNDWWGPKTSIFDDGRSAGDLHWVEWETSQPFFLTSFNLLALHDTPERDANHRGLSTFRLFARQSDSQDWTQLYELQPANPYQFTPGPDVIPTTEWGYLAVHAEVAQTLAQQFRAEFMQYGFNGPRVQALHGFGFTPTPGDADLDGDVDLNDFAILKANFAQPGKGWADGDFNGNSVPDLVDFGLLKENFGRGTAGGAAAVPEPEAWRLALLGVAGLGLAWRARRRRAAG